MIAVLAVLLVFPATESVAGDKSYKKYKQVVLSKNNYRHDYHDYKKYKNDKHSSSWSVSVNLGSGYHSHGYNRYHGYSGVRWPFYSKVIYRPYYVGYPATYYSSRTYYSYGGNYHDHSHYTTLTYPVSVNTTVEQPVSTELFVYPKEGQSEEQASRDRYECYLWAVNETGFDPSRSDTATDASAGDYVRASSACLEARGYTVK